VLKAGQIITDYAQVLVNEVVLTKIELCTKKSVNSWKPLTFNLTAYKNQTVAIIIQTSNDDSLISSFWVDDVGFVPATNYVLSDYGKTTTQSQSFHGALPVRPLVAP
jgi:L-lactate utilization protein LutC